MGVMMNANIANPSAVKTDAPAAPAHAVRVVAPGASTGCVAKLLLLAAGAALGACTLLCVGASVAGVAWGGFVAEQSQIRAVLHTLLGLMRDGELDQAHALFA